MKGRGGTLDAQYSVKEANVKRLTLYESSYMTPGKGNTVKTVKRSVMARLGGGEGMGGRR